MDSLSSDIIPFSIGNFLYTLFPFSPIIGTLILFMYDYTKYTNMGVSIILFLLILLLYFIFIKSCSKSVRDNFSFFIRLVVFILSLPVVILLVVIVLGFFSKFSWAGDRIR